MKLSRPFLSDYGATRSRHDFTQRQLMTCLVLRAYLKTTYRGVLDVLSASASLRQCLGLQDKLPHFTTLQKFSVRSNVLAIVQKLIAVIGQCAAQQKGAGCEVAMDATGLSRTTVSDYFCSRKGRRFRLWVKVSTVVVCGSLVPIALTVDLNPTHDCAHAPDLLGQTRAAAQPKRLFADAGYDAERIHVECRESWGVESVIPSIQRRADGKIGGKWRSKMKPRALKKAGFGRRWGGESRSEEHTSEL